MSETQLKVTGRLQAKDDGGNQYTINEYSVFRHTTDAEMQDGQSADKIYKLADGSPLIRTSETEFEIESSGIKICIVP